MGKKHKVIVVPLSDQQVVATPEAPVEVEVKPADSFAPGPHLAQPRINALMGTIPRMVEDAIETGHKALIALGTSAKRYAEAMDTGVSVVVEPLIAMLADVAEVLKARKDGAKTLTNAHIDAVLRKAGVKQAQMTRTDGQRTIGSKSGVARYLSLALYQTEALWDAKRTNALTTIKVKGIKFPNGQTYHSPFDALAGGQSMTSVYNVWTGVIQSIRQELTPTVKPTKAEVTAKAALNLGLDQRRALMAALAATIPVVEGASSPPAPEAAPAPTVNPS